MNARPPDLVGLVGAILISVIVLGGFIAISVLLFTHSIPPESKELALVMFGALASMATSVVQWWLGSSRGSQHKDSLIEAQRDQQQ